MSQQNISDVFSYINVIKIDCVLHCSKSLVLMHLKVRLLYLKNKNDSNQIKDNHVKIMVIALTSVDQYTN